MARIAALLILITTVILVEPAAAQRVLLLHDASVALETEEGQVVSWTRDILGHFDVAITEVAMDDYRPQLIHEHDAAIYVGLWESASLPETFLEDCYDSNHPFCWVGANLNELAERFSLGRYGFHIANPPPQAGPTKVVYRGMPYWREQTPLPLIVITRPRACETLAVIGQGDPKQPYAVRSHNFWYFPEPPSPSSGKAGTDLIFCDQLHAFLGQAHDVARTALLLISNVTPASDAGRLSSLIRYLLNEGAPFAIEVTPLNPTDQPDQYHRLSQKRGLVSVLRGAQRNGTAIVAVPPYSGDLALHTTAEATTEQSLSSLPPVDAISLALEEMTRCGLYPLAWSLDSRGHDIQEQHRLATICSTLIEHRSDSEGGPKTRSVPFIVTRTEHNQHLLPDNMPTLREGRGETEAILEVARSHTTVPDPWVTARIGLDAPTDAVGLLVNGFRNTEYGFLDLRHMANWTKTDSLLIRTLSSDQRLTDILPRGWEAQVIGPAAGAKRTIERAAAKSEDDIVHPGAILISYPPDRAPDIVFSFEGDIQQIVQRGVSWLAHTIVILAAGAAMLLFLLYIVQVAQRRGA